VPEVGSSVLCCARKLNRKNRTMLLELRAENYAVMDHALAGFGPGLNLLTGETGAGKSILVDALALLMGGKGSTDVIRHGAEKAVVSCVFEATPGAEAVLDNNGLDANGSEIILRREIQANGKGRVFVNNQLATVAVLRQMAPELALVHAQSETLTSFDQQQQLGLLDRFAGIATDEVAAAYQHWREIKSRLEELESNEQDRMRMADLWAYQKKEIEAAALKSGEDEELEAEKRRLANAEKIYSAAMGAFDQLYDGSASAESTLRAALKNLDELAKFDDSFREPVVQLTAALATVEDISSTVRDYAEGTQASPERLEEIEDRLAQLDRLKRKYGASLAEVIAFGADVAAKLTEIEDRDEVLRQLRAELAQAAEGYREAAGKLTTARRAAAQNLAKLAEHQINDLAMKVKFEVNIEPQDQTTAWSAGGWDIADFLIATNLGEPLKPLTEIASGGEMSRVLLALKVSVEEGSARQGRKTALPRTLIFDEIDIGIGGRAAEAVGQKLKALSRVQQVLCVTHLPQIAAFADQHLVVEKKESQGRTRTGIRLLEGSERTSEVARMLSGATVTETSLRHAEQMIAASR